LLADKSSCPTYTTHHRKTYPHHHTTHTPPPTGMSQRRLSSSTASIRRTTLSSGEAPPRPSMSLSSAYRPLAWAGRVRWEGRARLAGSHELHPGPESQPAGGRQTAAPKPLRPGRVNTPAPPPQERNVHTRAHSPPSRHTPAGTGTAGRRPA
jgi:hypothetical protein